MRVEGLGFGEVRKMEGGGVLKANLGCAVQREWVSLPCQMEFQKHAPSHRISDAENSISNRISDTFNTISNGYQILIMSHQRENQILLLALSAGGSAG